MLGAFFTLQGAAWIAETERAAAGLGMPLLDRLARSTQIGDLAAFFLAIGVSTKSEIRMPARDARLRIPCATAAFVPRRIGARGSQGSPRERMSR